MKILPLVGTMLLWPSFHGCDELVLFTEPQPVGADTLTSFPAEWLGCYRQQDDSAYVAAGRRALAVGAA